MTVLLLTLLACNGDDATTADSSTAVSDSGSAVTDSGTTDSAVPEDVCDRLGLDRIHWDDGGTSAALNALMPDMTVDTLDGPWSLSESWTGCESVIFMNYVSGYTYPEEVWTSSYADFFAETQDNVHYVFMSYATDGDGQPDDAQVETDVQAIKDRLEREYDFMDADQIAHWQERLHFVTESAWLVESLGEYLQSTGSWSVAIDRYQRLRETGYFSNPNSGWKAELRGMAWEAQWFDFEVARNAQVAALDATRIPLFDGSRQASATVEVTLPTAEEMAGFDSLHLELTLGCGAPEYEDCGEWDYLVSAALCDEPASTNEHGDTPCTPSAAEVLGACFIDGVDQAATCRDASECAVAKDETATCEGYVAAVAAETRVSSCLDPLGVAADANQTCNADGTGFDDVACGCSTEIGRWVTGYARGGQWVMDSSPLLAMLKDGGTRTIRWSSSYAYDLSLDLLLSDQGRGSSPTQGWELYGGGSFNEGYNDRYEPITVDVPADAQRVELYAVISGHGWGAERANCAEFCNHTHHFTINGTEYVKEHEEAGTSYGCADQIADGTRPNQYGTWPLGRGGWCPGKQVDPWIVDVTDAVTPGETATITYRGLYKGDDYVPESSGSGEGFGANITMVSYLVASE